MVDLERLLPALSEGGVEFIVAGGGTYEALIDHSRKLSVFGVECYCLGLDRLIQAKRDAGRPRDLEAIAELEALREE